ncbi:MAG TPA: glycosyltransferase family 4 protein [Chthoniobacterales bacterium]|jgi:glycosyltransferase involved in cell wall biosynthesis
MKITIVLGAFLPVPTTMGGAVEKMWLAVATEFARRGHQVAMISRAMPGLPREEFADGVRHLRVRGFDTPRSLLWLKFLDLIYSWRTLPVLPEADIIVTNTFWLPLLLRDASRGRLYVHVARFPKGQMRFYGRAARLQAPSTAVVRAIIAQAPALASRTAVVPYPAPAPATTSPPTSVAARERTILFVGRVHPEKGVHLLVQAFAAGARTVFADWKLRIVGPAEARFGGGGESYLASLEKAAQTASTQVTFTGSIFDPDELARRYGAARLFVYPSLAERGESFGLAPLEAMSRQCAVLVSSLECFADFVREGETGFIFDHRASDAARALGQKMEKILADDSSLERVAEGGYRKASEYSLSHVADLYLNDFHSVMQESHVAGTKR